MPLEGRRDVGAWPYSVNIPLQDCGGNRRRSGRAAVVPDPTLLIRSRLATLLQIDAEIDTTVADACPVWCRRCMLIVAPDDASIAIRQKQRD